MNTYEKNPQSQLCLLHDRNIRGNVYCVCMCGDGGGLRKTQQWQILVVWLIMGFFSSKVFSKV